MQKLEEYRNFFLKDRCQVKHSTNEQNAKEIESLMMKFVKNKAFIILLLIGPKGSGKKTTM